MISRTGGVPLTTIGAERLSQSPRTHKNRKVRGVRIDGEAIP